MVRPFNLEIAEEAEYLEKSLKQARSGRQKERLQMLWWVKSGQIQHRQEISERLSRSSSTITRWLSCYRSGGLSALLEEKKAPGAAPHIQGEALEKLLKIDGVELLIRSRPVPATERLDDAIEPNGFARPLHFGNGFDTFGGDHPLRLRLSTNAAFVLRQVA